MTIQLRNANEESFPADVINAATPVLVDFYADWCGPCKLMTPTLEAVAQEFSGQLDVIKVDVDQQQALARQFDVRGIPTLVLFKDGAPVETVVGLTTAKDLADTVRRHL